MQDVSPLPPASQQTLPIESANGATTTESAVPEQDTLGNAAMQEMLTAQDPAAEEVDPRLPVLMGEATMLGIKVDEFRTLLERAGRAVGNLDLAGFLADLSAARSVAARMSETRGEFRLVLEDTRGAGPVATPMRDMLQLTSDRLVTQVDQVMLDVSPSLRLHYGGEWFGPQPEPSFGGPLAAMSWIGNRERELRDVLEQATRVYEWALELAAAEPWDHYRLYKHSPLEGKHGAEFLFLHAVMKAQVGADEMQQFSQDHEEAMWEASAVSTGVESWRLTELQAIADRIGQRLASISGTLTFDDAKEELILAELEGLEPEEREHVLRLLRTRDRGDDEAGTIYSQLAEEIDDEGRFDAMRNETRSFAGEGGADVSASALDAAGYAAAKLPFTAVNALESAGVYLAVDGNPLGQMYNTASMIHDAFVDDPNQQWGGTGKLVSENVGGAMGSLEAMAGKATGIEAWDGRYHKEVSAVGVATADTVRSLALAELTAGASATKAYTAYKAGLAAKDTTEAATGHDTFGLGAELTDQERALRVVSAVSNVAGGTEGVAGSASTLAKVGKQVETLANVTKAGAEGGDAAQSLFTGESMITGKKVEQDPGALVKQGLGAIATTGDELDKPKNR